MKRGERAIWRKLEKAVTDLVLSENYAQEYMARNNVLRLVDDLKGRNIANVILFESFFNKATR